MPQIFASTTPWWHRQVVAVWVDWRAERLGYENSSRSAVCRPGYLGAARSMVRAVPKYSLLSISPPQSQFERHNAVEP
jgi:hypothetical protein